MKYICKNGHLTPITIKLMITVDDSFLQNEIKYKLKIKN